MTPSIVLFVTFQWSHYLQCSGNESRPWGSSETLGIAGRKVICCSVQTFIVSLQKHANLIMGVPQDLSILFFLLFKYKQYFWSCKRCAMKKITLLFVKKFLFEIKNYWRNNWTQNNHWFGVTLQLIKYCMLI